MSILSGLYNAKVKNYKDLDKQQSVDDDMVDCQKIWEGE